MQSPFSEKDRLRAILTLDSIAQTISQLIGWNVNISSVDDYYCSDSGMQLLAANCTLITAIGEGINRINKIIPGFLQSNFPDTPWHAIVGMRNHIAHGYFELDAEMIYEAITTDIAQLQPIIIAAKNQLKTI